MGNYPFPADLLRGDSRYRVSCERCRPLSQVAEAAWRRRDRLERRGQLRDRASVACQSCILVRSVVLRVVVVTKVHGLCCLLCYQTTCGLFTTTYCHNQATTANFFNNGGIYK